MDTETNRKTIIIGLYSPAPHSGKTTAGKIIEKLYGFEKFSFASPLKLMLSDAFACRGIKLKSQLAMASEKEAKIPRLYGKSYRELMQGLGDWGREKVNSNFWIDLLFNGSRDVGTKMIIDDVRFENECEAIKKRGGYLIKIRRAGVIAPNEHKSEGRLDDYPFDFIIENNSSMGWLVIQIVNLMTSLKINMNLSD